MFNSQIIFVGHFTVGEHLNDIQLKTIIEAKKQTGDLGIVVNDIDLKRRLQFFRIGGKDMVIRHYGNRKKCGTTKTLCELPEFQKIPDLIDWSFYEESLRTIDDAEEDMETVLRTQIIPAAIQARIVAYGLQSTDITIYTERALRNYAADRLSRTRQLQRSWRAVLKEIGVLEELQAPISGVPVCGALLLALYEQLAHTGYQHVLQLYAASDRGSIQNGECIHQLLRNTFPNDSRWQLNIQTTYI